MTLVQSRLLKPRIAFCNVENLMYCTVLSQCTYFYDYHSIYRPDLIVVTDDVFEERPEGIFYICYMS